VPGTIYEAIHYAVFSNFLLLSAIKVKGLINTVPKPRLSSVLYTKCRLHNIKTLRKHTNVYTSIASFQKAGRRAKHYEAAVCISPN